MKGTNEKQDSSNPEKGIDCARNKAGGNARAGRKRGKDRLGYISSIDGYVQRPLDFVVATAIAK